MSDPTKGGLITNPENYRNNVSRQNHLLVIGIDKYSKGIPPLNNPVRDAKAFRDLLWDKYDFDKSRTTCLFDEEATKDNILNAFYSLGRTLTDADNLVIYFSGHGELNDFTKKGYWIPVDAKAKSWGDYLSNDEVIVVFEKMKTHHIFGIVDSCFSGALFQKNINALEERLDRFPSRWLLTAGRNEPVFDGSAGENSPFAKALLTYLKNNDSSLWVSDLCNHVLRGVSSNTDKQTPRGQPLQAAGDYGGQFVFYPKGYISSLSDDSGGGDDVNVYPYIQLENAKSIQSEEKPDSKAPISVGKKPLDEIKQDLKIQVMDNLEDFFESVQEMVDPSSRQSNTFILQRSRYNRIMSESDSGLSSQEDKNRILNQLSNALLRSVDKLKIKDIKEKYRS